MANAALGLPYAIQFPVARMEIMGQHGPVGHQAIAFINFQIILALVKMRQNRFDFIAVFVDMGLQVSFWVVVQQSVAHHHHLF